MIVGYLLAAVVGAVANRIRGGWLGIHGGRFVWGAAVGCVAIISGLAPLLSLGAALFAVAGATMGQFGGLAMGQRGEKPRVSPWLTMTAWGLARVAGPVVMVAAAHGAWWWVALSGLACAPIYRAVWWVPGKWLPRGFGYGKGEAEGYDPPELAEAVHGAVMGVALVGAVA